MALVCLKKRLDRDFFELDAGAVGDAETELTGRLDVDRIALLFGEGLQAELGAELRHHFVADDV